MAKAKPSGLKKGDTVIHAKFGEGLVISIKNEIAEIAFPYTIWSQEGCSRTSKYQEKDRFKELT